MVGLASFAPDRLTELSKEQYVPSVAFAMVHAGIGETDRAFEWLDKAVEDREGFLLPFLKVPWWCDRLRSDPRFDELLRRVGTGDIASGLIDTIDFSIGDGTVLFQLSADDGIALNLGDSFTLIDYAAWDGDLFQGVADDSTLAASGYEFLIDYSEDLGGSDFALTTTMISEPLPAVSEWGLITMSLLMLTSETSVCRRRLRHKVTT